MYNMSMLRPEPLTTFSLLFCKSVYTLIISLLIEKPFYLLRAQSFSFQMVSEFIDIFEKFSNFMSRGGAFDSLFCPEGRAFVHNHCPGG